MFGMDHFIGLVLVIYSITLHELGHAHSSTWFGDPTPARHGRLTWNPIVQIHPVYTILAPIFTFAMMGFPLGFAYCPVDPSKYKNPLRDQALVAVAGPLVNFAVVLFCVILLWIPQITQPGSVNQSVCFGVGLWNILLGVFNLLPFPGLDGYMILRTQLPLSLRQPLDDFRKMGYLPLMVAFLVGGFVFRAIAIHIYLFYFSLLPNNIDFGTRDIIEMFYRWMFRG